MPEQILDRRESHRRNSPTRPKHRHSLSLKDSRDKRERARRRYELFIQVVFSDTIFFLLYIVVMIKKKKMFQTGHCFDSAV